jgi:hypothetical protein
MGRVPQEWMPHIVAIIDFVSIIDTYRGKHVKAIWLTQLLTELD